MRARSTLYEVLGVTATASETELQVAYRRAMGALEAQRPELTPEEFAEREQVLRVAHSTLRNSSLRADYDAGLAAAERAARVASIPRQAATQEGARADALGLRADALSLRADALLARAELDVALARQPSWTDALVTGVGGISRVIGLLAVVGISTFGLTRCIAGDPSAHRAAVEACAAEQLRLQEYALTYGVRPANIAELETMEAERQRNETQARQAEQERKRREEEKRRWEEEVRRVGQSVQENLERAEREARRKAEQDRELKFREEQLQLEVQQAGTEAERQRLELRLRQLRERRAAP